MKILTLASVFLLATALPACDEEPAGSEAGTQASTAATKGTGELRNIHEPLNQEKTGAKPVQEPAAKSKPALDFAPGKGIPDEDLGQYLVSMECSVGGEPVGTMTFEFWPEKAPITTRNFLRYASEGLYNGLTFHRIMKGFMIQGGDPTGTGSGKGKYPAILGEFSSNKGYELTEVGKLPKYKHVYGVISMARTGDPNSATSQIFICNDNASSLDGNYASFGKMSTGKAALDAITNSPVGPSSRGEPSKPLKACVMEKVWVHKKGEDSEEG